MPEKLRFEDALPIADIMMKSFLSGEYGEVYLLHMQFVTPCHKTISRTHFAINGSRK
jgi:F0F1-type ATP synthase gamma subunit